jgi:hypothetical protein
LVDGPGSSSNGHAKKISNDTHFGDGWDPYLVRAGALLAVWIILEEELFFEMRRHKWWQLYFDSPGVYAILSTSPAYYFGQLRQSFIWKKAMHPMAMVSY